MKDSAVEDLVTAIKAVKGGETYLSPKAANYVVRGFIGNNDRREGTVFDVLSPRELEILQLVVEGNSTREIAETLFISPKTVENHRANTMTKLDIHDIPSLVKFAIRMGLSKA